VRARCDCTVCQSVRRGFIQESSLLPAVTARAMRRPVLTTEDQVDPRIRRLNELQSLELWPDKEP
jgi:hypothetical protein